MKANVHRQKELTEKYKKVSQKEQQQEEEEATRMVSSAKARETMRREKGMPAYKGYKKTRLGAGNLATLEKVWDSGEHYPSDSTIQGIQGVTKLPTSKIINWFKEKRDKQKGKRHREHRDREAQRNWNY